MVIQNHGATPSLPFARLRDNPRPSQLHHTLKPSRAESLESPAQSAAASFPFGPFSSSLSSFLSTAGRLDTEPACEGESRSRALLQPPRAWAIPMDGNSG